MSDVVRSVVRSPPKRQRDPGYKVGSFGTEECGHLAEVGRISDATGRNAGCGTAVVAAVPVPLRLTVVVAFVDELLTIVSFPVAAPAAVGANFTVRVAVAFAASVK